MTTTLHLNGATDLLNLLSPVRALQAVPLRLQGENQRLRERGTELEGELERS